MWTRRRLFQLGLAGAVTSLVLGTAPVVGLDERAVLTALLDRLFDPGEMTAPVPSQTHAVDLTLELVDGLAPVTRLQVRGLLRALEFGALGRFGSRFSTLAAAEQDAWLLDLAEGPYPGRVLLHALKQLGAMGHYQQPSTWTALTYPGPLLDR